jgi:putative transposase
LDQQLETLRQIYNAALAYWKDLYAEEKKSPTLTTLYKLFASLRNLQIADQREGGSGPHWLTHISAVSMRDTLKRLTFAFANFFRRVKQKSARAGFPRFKSYGRLTSIPFDNYASGCTLRDAKGSVLRLDAPLARSGCRLDLFGVGCVKVIVHRPLTGKIKTACVQRDVDGKWYVILAAQFDRSEPTPSTNPAVGIDVGLKHFLTTSDGEHVDNPRILKKHLRELRVIQRSSSRKMESAKKRKAKFRECRNLQKSFRRVSRLHVRVRNLRKDHHLGVVNSLVNRYGVICAEDLSIPEMLRSRKFSRSISDAAWGGFLIRLQHKAENAGVRFVKVDARGTSQTCPQCQGRVPKELKDRKHKCPHCGIELHRDHASAVVILQRGTGAGGAGSVPAGHNPCNSKGVQRSLSNADKSVATAKSSRSRKPKHPPENRSLVDWR